MLLFCLLHWCGKQNGYWADGQTVGFSCGTSAVREPFGVARELGLEGLAGVLASPVDA